MKTLNNNILPVLFLILLSSCTFNASLRNLDADLSKGDQSSSPINLQKIFIDITSITLTEGSVAIINVAVNPVQTTDTIIYLNLTTSGSSYIRFNPIPSQVIIPAGSTSKGVVLNTIDDSLIQDQEIWSFSISSSNTNLHADPGILQVTLNDNDGGVIPGGPSVPMAKLLKEFNPYPTTVSKMSFNGKVFYVGTDATNGSELWVSDGSPTGTRLVKDIEPGPNSSSPSVFYHPPASPYLFFTATTASEGMELWVTDGTENGTYIIPKGFEPGSSSAIPQILLTHGNQIYYVAQTTVDGRELYVSDGTNAGTYMLYEFAPGTAGMVEFSMIADGNDIYFSAYGPPTYQGYIFKTDGTVAGTNMIVSALSNGTPLNDVADFDAIVNGRILFVYYDGSTGYELYTSGGTNATTGIIGDYYSGWNSSYAAAHQYYRLNGKAIVTLSYDGSGSPTGYYLSDGTVAGTVKINQSVYTNTLLGVISGGTKLVYSGCIGNYNCEPYVTSGVSGDSVLLKDIHTGSTGPNANSSTPIYAAQIADKILFTATSAAEGSELWVTDGTPAGTVLLKDIMPGTAGSLPSGFITIGSSVFFIANSNLYGEEIWVTDGTPAGTVLYKDLIPGATSSGAKNLAQLDASHLFFTAYNNLSGFGSVFTMDISNGNTSGLAHAMIESLNSETKSLVEYNGLVYFDARDSSLGMPLWVTNGTPSGTTKIIDLYPSSTCTDINYMTTYNGSLFFAATTQANGLELHISNGTTAGTAILKDLNATSTGSGISTLVKTATGRMIFTANHDNVNHGIELYSSDGTSAGTGLVMDINPGVNNSVIQSITAIPGTNKVIFLTQIPKAFWISDGTTGGTVQISGLSTINSLSNTPVVTAAGSFITYTESSSFKTRLYFVDAVTNAATHLNTTYTTDILSGQVFLNPNSNTIYYATLNAGGTSLNLWKSDGTVAGTTLLKNIPNAGNNLNVQAIGHIGNKTIFQYYNNTTSNPYVRQLWVTDGTIAGTTVIENSDNTTGDTYGIGTLYNGYLYYTRYHTTSGVELWKTDGTSANTIMVKDINPGTANSTFLSQAVYNGKLYFSANDGVHGKELWRTDGTLLGTEMVTDINPGAGDSSPGLARVLAGKLYFLAFKVLSGREVWVYSE